MKETEAINVLNMIEAHGALAVEAKEMAIKALEEVQKYRAIGTLEELIRGKRYMNIAKHHGTIGQVIDECVAYEAIGTPEECQAAMEKQTAKRPNYVSHSYSNYMWHKEHIGYCPDCGHKVEETYGCQNCLRKIDWSDEE